MTRLVACVVGTRPEAVKLAPVIHQLRREGSGIVCRILSTGQHRLLLDRALADFDLIADCDLDLMRPGQSLAELTGRALMALSACLSEDRPDLVLAVGDTTTVFATALACHYHRIPFGHVEAGLRTGEPYRPFPEEKNRELTARLSALHFAPTSRAHANLLREGITTDSVYVTGNTVIDALQMILRQSPRLSFTPPSERFLLVTAHRRENWGEPMREIALALQDLVTAHSDLGVVIPAHPNPTVREPFREILGNHPRVLMLEPLRYPEFVAAMSASTVIVTDSGGVQEEGPALGKPVIVLRPETERPETLGEGSWLVGTDRGRIVAAVEACLSKDFGQQDFPRSSPFGDGHASERIAFEIGQWLGIDAKLSDKVPPAWPPAD